MALLFSVIPGLPVTRSSVVRLLDLGSVLEEELPQQRTMTSGLVFTVTAHGEIRDVRERGQEREVVLRVRPGHLGQILATVRVPLGLGLRAESHLHRLEARREVREPHVIPVVPREAIPGHAARRAADRPHPQTLARVARRPEPHDPDTHAPTACSPPPPSPAPPSPSPPAC